MCTPNGCYDCVNICRRLIASRSQILFAIEGLDEGRSVALTIAQFFHASQEVCMGAWGGILVSLSLYRENLVNFVPINIIKLHRQERKRTMKNSVQIRNGRPIDAAREGGVRTGAGRSVARQRWDVGLAIQGAFPGRTTAK